MASVGNVLKRFGSGALETLKRLRYAFYILIHPFDGFFDLKNDPKRRTLPGAIVLLIFYALTHIIRRQTLGYLFTDPYEQLHLNLMYELMVAILPFILWSVANWCFSSLMDGDGKLSDIFMGTCFATLPMSICNLIQIPLSHFLTTAEQGVFTAIGSLGMVLAYAYVFLSMMIVHQYSVKKGVGTTILTILGMAVIAFIVVLIFFLLQQMMSFVLSLGTEIIFRLNE